MDIEVFRIELNRKSFEQVFDFVRYGFPLVAATVDKYVSETLQVIKDRNKEITCLERCKDKTKSTVECLEECLPKELSASYAKHMESFIVPRL